MSPGFKLRAIGGIGADDQRAQHGERRLEPRDRVEQVRVPLARTEKSDTCHERTITQMRRQPGRQRRDALELRHVHAVRDHRDRLGDAGRDGLKAGGKVGARNHDRVCGAEEERPEGTLAASGFGRLLRIREVKTEHEPVRPEAEGAQQHEVQRGERRVVHVDDAVTARSEQSAQRAEPGRQPAQERSHAAPPVASLERAREAQVRGRQRGGCDAVDRIGLAAHHDVRVPTGGGHETRGQAAHDLVDAADLPQTPRDDEQHGLARVRR